MKNKFVVFGLLVLISAMCLRGDHDAWADDRPAKFMLENGMTVLVKEMPSSPMVSVYALFKTGSATEGKYLGTGISHFLEHMLFKETETRGVGEIAAHIQSVGGTINASTGKDHTIYTITVPYEHFSVALEVLADMLMHTVFSEKEIEKERQVVFSEMRMRNDNPDLKLNELVSRNIYNHHPYQHPIIGYRTLLAKVTKADLEDYHKTFYTANNTVLSIAGNVSIEEILPQVKETFKGFERQREVVRNLVAEPPQITRRSYERSYPTDLTRLVFSYRSVGVLDEDLYALDALAKILGQGESSRLNLEIRKKRELVYQIAAYNYTPIDPGVFQIKCLLKNENTGAVISAVEEEIERVKQGGVTEKELAKAKRQVLSEQILGEQNTSSVARNQAVDEAFTGDHQFSKKYVEAIKNVSREDVLRVARQYLIKSSLTTVLLTPQTETIKEEEKPKQAASVIQKYVLDNGLTVLLREDHTFASISIDVVLNGGIRQEDPALNGIANLMSSLWFKGTSTRSAEQIAEFSESLGMSAGAFSGRNSFGIRMELLTEDLNSAMGLLEDVVLNSNFPEDEISKTKAIIESQIKRRDDHVFQFASKKLKELLYTVHPYRYDHLGTDESLARITRKDIDGFYSRLRSPSNMVIAVFGDIDPEATLGMVKDRFGALKEHQSVIKTHREPPMENPRVDDAYLDKEQAVVLLGFHAEPIGHSDVYGIEVMSSILGSSFSGRLFNRIREKFGQAYTLGGSYVPGIDTGFIYFYALTNEESLADVEKLIRKEIQKLQDKNVPLKELRDMKTYLKGLQKARLERNASLSFASSLDELYGLGYDHYQNYAENIDKVNERDVRRLAKKYLDLQKVAIVFLHPGKNDLSPQENSPE